MHKKKVNKIMLVLLVIACSFTIISCVDKTNSNEKTIRIGYFANITHSQALVGIARGDFEKSLGDKGKIEWKQFSAGPAEIEAFLANEVDIGYIGPCPALNAYSKSNGELQIIAGAANGGAILVAREGSNIHSISDLKGKKVAIPQFGNTQDITLRNLLKEKGLKYTVNGGDVEVRQVQNPDLKVLLDRGQIDAALVPEPWGTRLLMETNSKIILDNDQVWRGGNYSTSVLVVRTKFLKENPDIVENFIRTHVEITQFINNNVDQSKELINNTIYKITKNKLSKEILDNSFKRLKITYEPEKESIVDFVKISAENGLVKSEPNLNGFFNFDILNKVLKEKGYKQIR